MSCPPHNECKCQYVNICTFKKLQECLKTKRNDALGYFFTLRNDLTTVKQYHKDEECEPLNSKIHMEKDQAI